MGLRFRKSIKLGKHFSINLSPKGVGYSYGVKGARHSVSADGRHRTTYSVPGTGLTYTTSKSPRKTTKSTTRPAPSEVSRTAPRTTPEPTPKLFCPAFWLLFVLSLIFLAVTLLSDTHRILFGFLTVGAFVLAFHLKWRAEAEYYSAHSTESPEQPAEPAPKKKSRGCLVPFVAIIIILYFLGCSDADTDTSEQSTLPQAETSERAILPAESDETAEPEETEPPVVLPVVSVPETQPAAETRTPPHETETPETEPPKKTTYYLNTSSKKIHHAGCSSVDKIKDSNKSTTTDPDAKIAEGYTWCGNCH